MGQQSWIERKSAYRIGKWPSYCWHSTYTRWPSMSEGRMGSEVQFLLVIMKSIFFTIFRYANIFRNFWKILSKFSSETKMLKILSFYVLKFQPCMYMSHFFYYYFITHFLSFCWKLLTLFYLSITLYKEWIYFLYSQILSFLFITCIHHWTCYLLLSTYFYYSHLFHI